MADYEASADTLSADLTVLDSKIGTEDGSITALDGAITALDKLISQLQNAAAGTGTGTGSGGQRTAPTGTGRTAAPTGSANRTAQSPPVSTSTGEPASAARLAADQASIEAAEAQLNLAEQNLAAAILKSPATGTVAAIGLTAGASSSGQTITIVGTGVPGVTTTVPLGQIDEVKVGQSVSVAVDGVPTAVHGTVESIGLLSSTSGSSASFPVTVRLAATTRHLYDGSGADVVITTGTAANVVTVPISAVRSGIAGRHTVTVLSGGRTSTAPVTLGIAGIAVVQVKTGLKVGQQVVLAELSQALPTSSTSGNTGTFRFPGGFTGAGGGRNFGGGGR
jgi:multidrug resistance efflux pump